jgi:hypothetical protein
MLQIQHEMSNIKTAGIKTSKLPVKNDGKMQSSKHVQSVINSVPRNSEPTYWHATAVFCPVINSLPGTSLAAAAAAGSTLSGTLCIIT